MERSWKNEPRRNLGSDSICYFSFILVLPGAWFYERKEFIPNDKVRFKKMFTNVQNKCTPFGPYWNLVNIV